MRADVFAICFSFCFAETALDKMCMFSPVRGEFPSMLMYIKLTHALNCD